MSTDVTRGLVDEHKLILRMIALVEKNAKSLEQGKFEDWQFFLDAVDFIRNYADRFHHAKEEDVLFVALISNGMPAKQSPIEAMLIEHDQGREHVRKIAEAAKKALDGDRTQKSVILEHAAGYAELLRGHIEKEDTILYPLAERVLPEGVRSEILAAYESAELRTPGLGGRYQRLVERYEGE